MTSTAGLDAAGRTGALLVDDNRFQAYRFWLYRSWHFWWRVLAGFAMSVVGIGLIASGTLRLWGLGLVAAGVYVVVRLTCNRRSNSP